MARCAPDRDPDEEECGVFPYFENSYPVPGDNRFYEGNYWHPPHSHLQRRKEPREQLSTRGRQCLYQRADEL
eukprot:3170274-Lingulodinium_polyedra.AAC.1